MKTTEDLIKGSYNMVKCGSKKVVMENKTHEIKAYQMGQGIKLIRIDVKEK